MKRTAAALALISVLLLSALSGALLANSVWAQPFKPLPELPPPIYIRSDGSIEPSIAPIKKTGNVYTLTGNIDSQIEVQRDNILIDGKGFTLTKPPVDTDELMTPVGWLPSISISSRNNVTVKNIMFDRCYTGITAVGSTNIAVTENTFKYVAKYGIVFRNCHDSTIIGNIMFGNWVAIKFLENADRIDIKYNEVSGCDQHAIWGGVSNSNIIGNNIVGNNGIALYSVGSFNRVIGNNLENNDYGVLCYQANNEIHHNNFVNNKVEQFQGREPNSFDDGNEGNYWSDYSGEDSNGDGIGDTAYIKTRESGDGIVESVRDRYPHMSPYVLDHVPPVVNVVLPESGTYTITNVTVVFLVDEFASWMGYSLDGKDVVRISENITLTNLSYGSHNLEVYAEDVFGNKGTSETICFSITEPFPATLTIASIATVAVFSVGFIVYFRKRKR